MTTETDEKDRALKAIRSDIEATRARLAETLDAIEERVNVPKRVRRYVDEKRAQFDALREEQPLLVYGVASAAVAAVVGLTTLAVVRAARS